jgi:hypothetical protein
MSGIIQRCRRLLMKYILPLILMIIFTLLAYAQETNYCHDPESWKEWDALIEKYPGNMDIQMLHAVRIGLCKKIEDGTISFETAGDAFDVLHYTVYRRAQEAQQQWLKDHRL